ncbi:g6301 [Coccomyxa elongata]
MNALLRLESANKAACTPAWQILGSRGCADRSFTDEDIVGIYTSQTKKLWIDRLNREKALVEGSPLPTPTPKPPQRLSISYPFATSPLLQEQYRNPWGYVRMGKVLEDLDSFAGNIAYEHCDDGRTDTRPPLLVTASVDAIDLKRRLRVDKDMIMAGEVVWTGSSSMDIRMELLQDGSEEEPSLVALFTFVARDPIIQKSMKINPLEPSTVLQKQRFAERQGVADRRKSARKAATQAFADDDRAQASAAWVEERLAEARTRMDLPALARGDSVLMRDTRLSNIFTCQPQQKNMHGRVFGGFLSRRAFELAFATAYLFAGCRPTFLHVGEITFQKPVEVGDLLRFHSTVLHTSENRSEQGFMHVEVVAMVTRPEQVMSNITNTFHLVFCVDSSRKKLKKVLPATAEEARKMLQAASDDEAHFL